jgi:uncharacterized protein with von Willebrand factor type A (vWA) domain
MPPRAAKKPAKRSFPPLPENSSWVENDAYDRRVWQHLRAQSPSLAALEQSGSMFLPHFGSLLQDIFCVLFKYNVSFRDDQEVLPSALLNRTFLDGICRGGQYQILREQTLLNEAHAGLSTVILGERLLGIIREQKLLNQRDLRDLWDIRKQEEVVGEKMEEYEDADTIPEDALSEEGKKALQRAKENMAGEVQGAQALLRHKSAQLKDDLERLKSQASQRLQAETIKVAQQLEDASEQAETWGDTIGTGERSPPGQKLELGRRLAGNEKLKKLARMVGRMKLQSQALRKKVFERASEEVLEVEQGDSLHRLLPNELLSLHHPLLRKDFYRRFLDQELIQYALRGVEQKGKGPMIVCLDGSSSMSGDKEIWSKAVALTLLDIARRQRRLFRSICFSSAETPLQVLDMNPRDRYQVESKTVLDLAEYFPGGGTDFQTPLDAALECLREARFKKGDVVFITDGECQVSSEWAEQFRKEKERLGFSLFSVLIDMGPASLGTLQEFSDRITTIKQLTGEGAKDIFIEF